MKKFTVVLLVGFVCMNAFAQKVTQADKDRAAALVRQMTLEEKIDYIAGFKSFYIRAIERLGIPEIRMADGPQGVRNNTMSTLYPSGIAAAATWDRNLVEKMGEGLGQDSRARGVHILLGPGVNIYRSARCGRNFEYFGEDPFLSGETAKAYIEGIQSQGVMACVKHFAGNNSEWSRHKVSSDIDERTLHEIYLPAFEKAVKEAGVGSVMNSYNLLNSVHSTENTYLNIDVLRELWGFEGILMSDWTSTYSPIMAPYNGLDLEMSGPKVMNRQNLIPLVENGVIDVRYIDLKVQHILQTLIAFGFFDRPQLDPAIHEKNHFSDSVSLELSRSAIVLLQNTGNFLPLKKGKVVVMGPHADMIVTGGGSGFVTPLEFTTVASAMSAISPKLKTQIIRNVFTSDLGDMYADKALTLKGAKAEYFLGKALAGEPVDTEVVTSITKNWYYESPRPGLLPNDGFSCRYTMYRSFTEPVTFNFRIGGDDGYRLKVDGKTITGDWSNHSLNTRSAVVEMEAGLHEIVYEFFDSAGAAEMLFEYEDGRIHRGDEKLLREADAVICCVGFDSETECEGRDRTFAMNDEQMQYLNRAIECNKNVIVVLNGGGEIEMTSWKDKVKAVLMAWYPGQQGGRAVAEIISGQINPSGRLPISFSGSLESEPAYESYLENTDRIRGGADTYPRVAYKEGLFIGYRGHDKMGTEPLYPFGYGLSYTTFEYSALELARTDTGVDVTFTVKNTGKRAGADVPQVYVSDLECSLVRPLRELKGYEKVNLAPGQSKRVTISLGEEAFRFWDSWEHRFKIEPGEFRISVGSNERNIHLEEVITL